VGLSTEIVALSVLFGLLPALVVAWMFRRKDTRLYGRPHGFQKPGSALLQSFVRRCGRKRRNAEVLSQWPTLLEGMAVAVIAGMDMQSAFEICSARTHGFLRQAASKVVLRLHSGLPLASALAIMENEGIEPARRLRTTLVQAESLGTPVAEVLSTLSAEYYTLEKQSFEYKLNSLPVKLSVITVVFLLPPVLIVSIAPHVIAFMGTKW